MDQVNMSLEDALKDKGLADTEYWLHVLKKKLNITTARTLEKLTTKDIALITEYARHDYEKNIFKSLVSKKQTDSEEAARTSREKEMEDVKSELSELQEKLHQPAKPPDSANVFDSLSLYSVLGAPQSFDGKQCVNSVLASDHRSPNLTRSLGDDDLVNRASGGLVLQGILFSGNRNDLFQNRKALLRKLTKIETNGSQMTAASDSFEFESGKSFEEHHKTIHSLGYNSSVALTGIMSKIVGVGVGWEKKSDSNIEDAARTDENTYICVRQIFVPTASFDMPSRELRLSEDAVANLKELETANEIHGNSEDLCLNFFNDYGTHVNTGKIHLGGTFILRAEVVKSSTAITNETKDDMRSSLSCHVSGIVKYVGLAVSADRTTQEGTSDKTIKQNQTEVTHVLIESRGGVQTENFKDWRDSVQKSEQHWAVIHRGEHYEGVWRIIDEKHNDVFKDAKLLAERLYQCWKKKTSSKDEVFEKGIATHCLRDLSDYMSDAINDDNFCQNCASYVQHIVETCKNVPIELWATFSEGADFMNFLNKIQQVQGSLAVQPTESIKRDLKELLRTSTSGSSFGILWEWCECQNRVLSASDHASIIDFKSLLSALDNYCEVLDECTDNDISHEVNVNASFIFSAALKRMYEAKMVNEVAYIEAVLMPYNYESQLGFERKLRVSDIRRLREQLAEFQDALDRIDSNTLGVQRYVLQKVCMACRPTGEHGAKEDMFRALTKDVIEQLNDPIRESLYIAVRTPIDWTKLEGVLANSRQHHGILDVFDAILKNRRTDDQQNEATDECGCVLRDKAREAIQFMNLHMYCVPQLDTETIRQVTKKYLHYSFDGLVVASKTIYLDYLSLRKRDLPCIGNTTLPGMLPGLLKTNTSGASRSACSTGGDALHWNDITLLLFYCCDNFLKQLLVEKLFLMKFAVPFVLPSLCHETDSPSVLLWSLRGIVPMWKTPRTSSPGRSVVDIVHPIICFIRVGQLPYSKSNLVNRLLSPTGHETFVHDNGKHRTVSDGLVEISWLLPDAINESWELDTMLSFTNLRGDARKLQDVTSIVCSVSSLVVILISSKTLKDKTYRDAFRRNIIHASCCYLLCAQSAKQTSIYECLDFLDTIFTSNPTTFQREETVVFPVESDDTQAAQVLKYRLQHSLKSITVSKTIAAVVKELEAVAVDEMTQRCKEMNDNVLKLIEIVRYSNDIHDHLPLQGDLWKEWCALERKNLRQDDIDKSFDFQYAMHIKKQDIRRKQFELLTNVTAFQLECFKLFANPNIQSLGYAICWLKIMLGDESRNIGNATAKFGLTHILREFGQIYEIVTGLADTNEYSTDKSSVVSVIPDAMARLMLNGTVFELMDGDASFVPVKWVKAVFDALNSIIGNTKRIFVISVVGVQSSGKSTLLNTMFGLQFAVKSGRCTRGVNCRLIAVDKQRTELDCDYFLVVDTEGLRSNESEVNERIQRRRDNELATFAIGIANVCILNIMGEDLHQIKDILQIVIHALISMKAVNTKIDICPRCIFVHQNVGAVDAKDAGKQGLDKLIDLLNLVTRNAGCESGCNLYNRFNDLIAFDPSTDVWMLPGLWSGSPPMAPVSSAYSSAVAKLKEFLITDLAKSPSLVYIQAAAFGSKIEDIWQAVVTESFVTNFRSHSEIVEFQEIEIFYSGLKLELDNEALTLLRKADKRFSSSVEESIEEAKTALLKMVDEKLQSSMGKSMDELKAFLNQRRYNHWKTHFSLMLQNYAETRRASTSKEITLRFKITEIRFQYDKEFEHLGKYIQHNLDRYVKSFSDQVSESDIEHLFDEEWFEASRPIVEKFDRETVTDIDIDAQHELYDMFVAKREHVTKALAGGKLTTEAASVWSTSHLLSRNLPEITDGVFKYHHIPGVFTSRLDWRNEKRVANDCLEEILLKIASFMDEVQKEKYARLHISQILTLIAVKFAKDVRERTKYEIKSEYLISLSVAVLKQVVPLFKMIQNKFREKYDYRKRLLQLKENLHMWFFSKWYAFRIEKATDAAAAHLVGISISVIKASSIRKLADSIQKRCSENPEITNKTAFLKSILKDLQARRDFRDYIEFINDFPSYARRYTEKLLNASLGLDSEFSQVVQKIQKSESDDHAKKVDDLPTDSLEKFLDAFEQLLNEDDSFTKSKLKLIIKLSVSSIEDFMKLYRTKLEEAKNSLVCAQTIKDIIVSDERNLCEFMYDTIRGCDVQCPLCYAPCCLDDSNHGGKHTALNHYPLGASGVKGKSNNLYVESCVFFLDDKSRRKELTFHRGDREVLDNCESSKWDVIENRTYEANKYWFDFIRDHKEALEERYGASLPDISTVVGDGCFPGGATVLTPSGRPLRMSELQVGDQVITVDNVTGEPRYDEVITFLHRSDVTVSNFIVIETESGQKLTITPTHLIYTSPTSSKHSARMVFADKVVPGHYVFCFNFSDFVSGDFAAPRKVLSISHVSLNSGVYSPLTKSGILVVDGIVASCYALFSNHQLAQMAMFPLRVAYFIRKIVGKERYEWTSTYKNGEHHYTVILTKVCRYIFPSTWWFKSRSGGIYIGLQSI